MRQGWYIPGHLLSQLQAGWQFSHKLFLRINICFQKNFFKKRRQLWGEIKVTPWGKDHLSFKWLAPQKKWKMTLVGTTSPLHLSKKPIMGGALWGGVAFFKGNTSQKFCSQFFPVILVGGGEWCGPHFAAYFGTFPQNFKIFTYFFISGISGIWDLCGKKKWPQKLKEKSEERNSIWFPSKGKSPCIWANPTPNICWRCPAAC